MSVLPQYASGRISIPWWYGLGYIFGWITAGIIGIKGDNTMEIILSNLAIIAMAVSALVGSLAFTISIALSKYAKQKTDAEKLKSKLAEAGRDPEDLASLTAAERWEIVKAQKFDRMFLIAYALTAVLGTALACAVLVMASDRITDDWEHFAVFGLIAGIVASWFLYETVTKSVMAGEWQKKSAEAFRIVKAVADKTAEVEGGYAALVQKYITNGISKKEAQKLAKEAIVANPGLLDKE